MRYTLIGGHSAGRVVEFDGPAPPSVDVAYRVPAEFPLDLDPGEILLGIERYERVTFSAPPGGGPPFHGYVCGLPK